MSDGPSTSWANWAWLACGDGRLVEVSEVRLQVFGLTARAEKAEAERDRLRAVLEAIVDEYNGQVHGPIIYSIDDARAALKGETP